MRKPSSLQNKLSKEITLIVDKANLLRKKGDFNGAGDIFLALSRRFPDNYSVAKAATACVKRADLLFEEKISHLETFMARFPGDEYLTFVHLQMLAYARRFKEAEEILESAESSFPKNPNLPLLKVQIAKGKGQPKEALKWALAGVAADPKLPQNHNNLGTALADIGLLNQALESYKTAVTLDPNFVEAIGNTGYAYAQLGMPAEAAGEYDRAIALLEEDPMLRKDSVYFPASFANLMVGRLTKGWKYYESGFNNVNENSTWRNPIRYFDKPKWGGEPIPGKTLLLWREQGLGDELMFLSCLPDIISKSMARITLEVDPRLVSVLTRSFPDILVRPAYTQKGTKKPLADDYDFHLPLGSSMLHTRASIDDFRHAKPIIRPNQKDVVEVGRAFERDRLDGFRIGICWRSGNLGAQRERHYLNLAEYAPILTTPGIEIVNLQYGDTSREIEAARRTVGVQIKKWPDLDLKNDLEGVFAVMEHLDLVISVGTAVAVMSAALGKPTVRISPRTWTSLGTDGWPWYPGVQQFSPAFGHDLAEVIPSVRDYVQRQIAIKRDCQSPELSPEISTLG